MADQNMPMSDKIATVVNKIAGQFGSSNKWSSMLSKLDSLICFFSAMGFCDDTITRKVRNLN